ncbi:MAG: CAP domain-containing protein [Lachnospiraceae bacterium]|nr:CAP domain-containing protein [Lachnospiraceae bacterium]
MNIRKRTIFVIASILITTLVTNSVQALDGDSELNEWEKVTPYEIGEEHTVSTNAVSKEISENLSTNMVIEELGTAPVCYDICYQENKSVIEKEYSDTEVSTGSSINLSKSGDLSILKPSQKQISQMSQSVTNATARFSQYPGTVNPYSLGTLCDGYLESALSYVNYIRYLAGLNKLELNSNLNTSAQYGAVVLAANNILTHTPSQPAGMNDTFYKRGYDAAGSSNIYSRSGTTEAFAPMVLKRSIDSYMKDNNSSSNLMIMGHRRWVLYPYNVQTGFGQADSSSGKCMAVMKVMIGSCDKASDDPEGAQASKEVDYEFISWPASGNFPTEMFDVQTPWTITLNPAYYLTPVIKELKVTVKRIEDGKEWVLTSADANSNPDNTDKYLAVNTKYTGINNCIIFHLGSQFDQSGYQGIYQVTVEGIKNKISGGTSLSYQINFFKTESPNDEEGETNNYNPAPSQEIVIQPVKNRYEVTFHPENGEKDYLVTGIEEGSTLEMPDTPIYENHDFQGWYGKEEEQYTLLFDDTVGIIKNYQIYARWKEKEDKTEGKYNAENFNVSKIKQQEYTGQKIYPDITVKSEKTILVRNRDYRIRYQNNKDAGTGIIIIQGIGEYKGSKTTDFIIAPRKISMVDIWYEDQSATGYQLTPKIHSKDSYGTLIEGKDYSAEVYSGNLKRAGKVTMLLTGKSNYRGSVKKTFTIYANSTQLIGKLSVGIDVKNDPAYQKDMGGYLYNGSAIKPKICVSTLDGEILTTKYYNVAYKNNKNAGLGIIIVTGKKPYKGSLKLYFTIEKKNIEDDNIIITDNIKKEFTGSYINPKVNITNQIPILGTTKVKKVKLRKKNDYKVYFSDNYHQGIASITIIGSNNYTGARSMQFQIEPKTIEKGITVKGIGKYKFQGEPVRPAIELKYKNYCMKEERDYSYIISNNEAPGKGIIKIIGKGDFKGSLLKYFVIK